MPVIGSRGAWQGAERLDEEARRLVQGAETLAASYGMRQATPDALLRALIDDDGGPLARVLVDAGVDVAAVRATLDQGLDRGSAPLGGRSALDADTREAVVLGINEARRDGIDQAGAGHLLLGLVESRTGKGVRLLTRQGANLATLRSLVHDLNQEGGGAAAALFAASFPRFLAQVGGAVPCLACGAPLHDSFHYCYNCGAQREYLTPDT